MKILLVNKFLYPKGGDAISTVATGNLLSEKGHQVFYFGMKNPKNPDFSYQEYFVSDVDYDANLNFFQKLKLTFRIFYSWEARNKVGHLLKKVKPDIVHLNNFAHQITPSILDEIKKYHIPVVMTMRDYKIVCPSYSMLANGKPCKRCRREVLLLYSIPVYKKLRDEKHGQYRRDVFASQNPSHLRQD